MLRVVIVFLSFNARIRQVIDDRVQSKSLARNAYHLREFKDGELFRELIEYAKLPSCRRMQTSQFNAAHCVANVEESARLATLPIDSKWVLDRGLHAKTVQSRPEDFVIVETIDQCRIQFSLIRNGAIDHALIQVGSANAPDLAAKVNIVAVMNLRQVIERSRLLRKRQHIFASIVLDADESFFDVDVRSAVFTHCPQFDQMAVGLEFLDREQNVQCSNHIVNLAENCMPTVDHRVWRRPLLSKMDHGLGRKLAHNARQKLIVQNVANKAFDRLTRNSLPCAESLGESPNRRQSLRTQFVIPGTALKTIDDCHVMFKA